jgi:preprotein translocase SecE subunit
MSEKKKSAGQGESEELKAQASEKELKSARASREERSAREESKAQASEKELKSARASREERSVREERQSKPANKPAAKRDARSTQASSKKSGGWRNWPFMRFVRESYRELRYKVTWPTFEEARNMTIVVILLSTVIGLILGLLDQGLLQAFKAITGK